MTLHNLQVTLRHFVPVFHTQISPRTVSPEHSQYLVYLSIAHRLYNIYFVDIYLLFNDLCNQIFSISVNINLIFLDYFYPMQDDNSQRNSHRVRNEKKFNNQENDMFTHFGSML